MSQPTTRFSFVATLIAFAALSRLLPHPPNFAPIGAMALFGAAYLPKKWLTVVVPLVALWLSSLLIDNTLMAQWYDGFVWFSNPWVYVALLGIVGLGWVTLRRVTLPNVVGSALGASVLFFLVSNFGVWLAYYPNTLAGLTACYAAAVPFFHWTLLGDLFFCGVLFGAYEMALRRGWAVAPSKG